MPDVKLLGLLKIMQEVLDQQEVGRKFNSQTNQTCGGLENRTNKSSTSNAGTTNNCISILHYFRSSINREAERRKEANY